MENKFKKKESRLVFEPRIARKLLKMNDEVKFCPFCGVKITDNCECHKNIVIDIKPFRNDEGETDLDRTVMVFLNNKSFRDDYYQVREEMAARDAEVEAEVEVEQLSMDLD